MLKQIKHEVFNLFPGKSQNWVKGLVKEVTHNGDLRKTLTWQVAYVLLKAKVVSIGSKKTVKSSNDAIATKASTEITQKASEVKKEGLGIPKHFREIGKDSQGFTMFIGSIAA